MAAVKKLLPQEPKLKVPSMDMSFLVRSVTFIRINLETHAFNFNNACWVEKNILKAVRVAHATANLAKR